MRAAWRGDSESVLDLLAAGADQAIANQGDTAFSLAVAAGHSIVAECLQKPPTDPISTYKPSITTSISTAEELTTALASNATAVKVLLDKTPEEIWAASIYSGHTVLCGIVNGLSQSTDLTSFMPLIAHTPACTPVCPATMSTALACCCAQFPDEALQAVMSKASAESVNTKGSDGDTLINVLIRLNKVKTLAAVLDIPGVHTKAKGASLQSALACAANSGNETIVQMLLAACGRPGTGEGCWSFGEIAAAAAAAERAGHGKVSQSILYG